MCEKVKGDGCRVQWFTCHTRMHTAWLIRPHAHTHSPTHAHARNVRVKSRPVVASCTHCSHCSESEDVLGPLARTPACHRRRIFLLAWREEASETHGGLLSRPSLVTLLRFSDVEMSGNFIG